MNHHYNDIRSRISAAPLWWDEHAVPRYDVFAPDECADLYADEAVLMRVACQNCERAFDVCMTSSVGGRAVRQHQTGRAVPSLADAIRAGTIHYGDPPNIECCLAGPTMNSIPVRVLEYWRQPSPVFNWERDGALEIDVDCAWARDEA